MIAKLEEVKIKWPVSQKGIFWVAVASEEDLWAEKFKLHWSKGTENHQTCWTRWMKEKSIFNPYRWYHWPRGKITRDPNTCVTTIHINPVIAVPAVIQMIKNEFGLTGTVKISKDHSGEFDSEVFDMDD